jgi:hypothetical protein
MGNIVTSRCLPNEAPAALSSDYIAVIVLGRRFLVLSNILYGVMSHLRTGAPPGPGTGTQAHRHTDTQAHRHTGWR